MAMTMTLVKKAGDKLQTKALETRSLLQNLHGGSAMSKTPLEASAETMSDDSTGLGERVGEMYAAVRSAAGTGAPSCQHASTLLRLGTREGDGGSGAWDPRREGGANAGSLVGVLARQTPTLSRRFTQVRSLLLKAPDLRTEVELGRLNEFLKSLKLDFFKKLDPTLALDICRNMVLETHEVRPSMVRAGPSIASWEISRLNRADWHRVSARTLSITPPSFPSSVVISS